MIENERPRTILTEQETAFSNYAPFNVGVGATGPEALGITPCELCRNQLDPTLKGPKLTITSMLFRSVNLVRA